MPSRQGSTGKSQGSAENKQQAKSASSNQDDLKSREYRDEKGEVHHHTKKYMEQHKGDKQ